MKKTWKVYMLECSDGTLYTGVTNDIERRMRMHADGNGSKYVRARGFSRLLHVELAASKSDAMTREAKIKSMKRREKLLLFKGSSM